MNVSRLALSLALVGLAVAPWLTLVPQADAADAKAKCRVGANPARVQIAVGANGLAAGTAQFQVTAGGNASSVLTNAVDALGDAAALPTISIVEKFTEDFEMYLARQEVMV